MVNAWKFFRRLKCRSISCGAFCCSYESLQDDHMQVLQLPNGASITILGYEKSYLRTLMVSIVSLFTLLIGLVVMCANRKGLVPWLYRRTTLGRATKILIEDGSFSKGFNCLAIDRDSDGRRWFEWRHYRLAWCEQSKKFKRVRAFDEIGLRLNDIHGFRNGLDPSNHQLRKNSYGDNSTDVTLPNIFLIFLSAVFQPFRIFQILAIVLWCFRDYFIYAIVIGILCAIELSFHISIKYLHQRKLYRLSLQGEAAKVTVIIPGQEKRRLLPRDLVPGCVIELHSMMIMPCDAVILSGDCLSFYSDKISEPLHKYQLPRSRTEMYDTIKFQHHTLFRGSTIILNASPVLALVVRTGWMTDYGRALAAKLEDKEYPSTFDLNTTRLFISLAVAGFSAAIYSICIKQFKYPEFNVMTTVPSALGLASALSIVSVCLPPLFSAALFFTSLYPIVRLYKNRFRFCSSSYPASMLNRVGRCNTLCLLENAAVQDSDTSLVNFASTRYEDWLRDPQLTLCMATCNSLTIVNGQLSGCSTELKMLPQSVWKVHGAESSPYAATFHVQSVANDHEMYRVTRIHRKEIKTSMPLTLVRVDPIDCANAASWYFIKGSYDSLLEFAEDFSFSFDSTLSDSAAKGGKLMAFAGRPLTEAEKCSNLVPELGQLLKKFQLLGVVELDIRISPETIETVAELRTAQIRTLLISNKGDEEALRLARRIGIILPKEPVAKIDIPYSEEQCPPSLSVIDLPEAVSASNGGQDQECTIQHHDHVVLNGDTLDALMQLFPELVDRVVDRVTVFSSSSAAQTDSLLKILQRSGRDLIVCKNGEDHSPILSSITSLTISNREGFHSGLTNNQGISCVRDVLRQSRAALVGGIGISKVMVCYAAARLTSTLLYDTSPVIQQLFVDLLLVMLLTVAFGSIKANNMLSKRLPAQSIGSPREITSVIAQLVIIVVGQWGALMMAQHQPWFEPSNSHFNSTDISVSTDENYAVYSLSLFQYLTIFLVFSAGPPHRRRIWTSPFLIFLLVGLSVLCSVMILEPPIQLQQFMSLKLPPIFDFRLAIFSLAIVSFFTSSGLQFLIDYLPLPKCRRSQSARSLSPHETPLESINVLYRPSSLTVHQQTSGTCAQSTLHLPIF